LSGFIVAIAFPPWNQNWLIWVGFVPVLSALLLFSRHWALSILRGAIFGGTFGGLVFYWLLRHGHRTDWLTNTMSLALLGALWGLFIGFLVQLPAKSDRKRLAPILPGQGTEGWEKSMAHLRAALMVAAAWTALEWARGVLLPGWNPAGAVLQANLPLLQVVKITGPSGLTFMAVFSNMILLTTVRRLILEPGRMTWADRFDVTATLAVIFLSAIAGFWFLEKRAGDETKNIALVHLSGTEFSRYLELSKAAAGNGIDLFVWRSVRFERGDYTAVGDASIGKTAALVSGITTVENGVLDGATTILPGTVKNKWVMPGRRNFFQPGLPAGSRTLSAFDFANTSWVTLLNWEAGDPLLVKSAIKGGVQVLVALVDPSLLTQAGLEQMLQNLKLWTVSMGRPLVFSAAKELSVIVSGSGRSASGTRSAPASDVVIGRIEIPPEDVLTVYGRYGDWFAIACGVVAIFTAFSERLSSRYEKAGRFSP
jgi:apolipoprotein N-acyltransferase